jgi:hypothetical protein
MKKRRLKRLEAWMDSADSQVGALILLGKTLQRRVDVLGRIVARMAARFDRPEVKEP